MSLVAALLAAQLGLAGPAHADPGDLDLSFGIRGKVWTDFAGGSDTASAVALQWDGKILAAGETLKSLHYDFALARYDTDGNLDPSFGTGGIVSTDFAGGDEGISDVVLQGNGKVVAAGGTSTGGGADFALARYDLDGALDASFGTGGIVNTDFAGGNEVITAVVLQGNGKIVAAGATSTGGDSDFALARYNPDGALDPSFGTEGRVTTDFDGAIDSANAVVLQGNGKIVAGGVAVSGGVTDFALARYNRDGTLDRSFGAGGRARAGFPGAVANALALQGDGKIVAAGWALTGINSDFALARYEPDGTLDRSFGRRGRVKTDFADTEDTVSALALQGDGKIVAAGFVFTGGPPHFALVRYDRAGTPDRSFGTGGKVRTGGASGEAIDLAVQGDGKAVAVGMAYTEGWNFALVRYLLRAR